MPPCVRIIPLSSTISPGPTCCQLVKSLPLKSGVHWGAWARSAGKMVSERASANAECRFMDALYPAGPALRKRRSLVVLLADGGNAAGDVGRRIAHGFRRFQQHGLEIEIPLHAAHHVVTDRAF